MTEHEVTGSSAADREAAESAPDGVDPGVPSLARMHDYFLSGSENYAADRAAAELVLAVAPSARSIARANRYFLMHAAVQMADAGIRQFIDLGTGIATRPSVHQIAQAICPDARVVYVDRDPVAVAHNKAILAGADGVAMIQADISDPGGVIADPVFRDMIDLSAAGRAAVHRRAAFRAGPALGVSGSSLTAWRRAASWHCRTPP